MFNAFLVILSVLWTGIIFAVAFTLDNPTREEVHFFKEHPLALLGLALFYAFGLIIILFVPKILFRRNAASLLHSYGLGRPEIYQNDFFYTDKNGWDLALDRREHKIAFMLYPKIISYDFKEMSDFGILIEKNAFNKDERDIYLNCFFGKQGVEMVTLRAGKIRTAEKFLRALQGVAPSGKLSQATKELRAALKPGQTTLEEEEGAEESASPKPAMPHQAPQDESKRAAEAERRASFEEERRRIIESERQKMLAELQAMVMQQEDVRNMPGMPPATKPDQAQTSPSPTLQAPAKPETPAPEQSPASPSPAKDD